MQEVKTQVMTRARGKTYPQTFETPYYEYQVVCDFDEEDVKRFKKVSLELFSTEKIKKKVEKIHNQYCVKKLARLQKNMQVSEVVAEEDAVAELNIKVKMEWHYDSLLSDDDSDEGYLYVDIEISCPQYVQDLTSDGSLLDGKSDSDRIKKATNDYIEYTACDSGGDNGKWKTYNVSLHGKSGRVCDFDFDECKRNVAIALKMIADYFVYGLPHTTNNLDEAYWLKKLTDELHQLATLPHLMKPKWHEILRGGRQEHIGSFGGYYFADLEGKIALGVIHDAKQSYDNLDEYEVEKMLLPAKGKGESEEAWTRRIFELSPWDRFDNFDEDRAREEAHNEEGLLRQLFDAVGDWWDQYGWHLTTIGGRGSGCVTFYLPASLVTPKEEWVVEEQESLKYRIEQYQSENNSYGCGIDDFNHNLKCDDLDQPYTDDKFRNAKFCRFYVSTWIFE